LHLPFLIGFIEQQVVFKCFSLQTKLLILGDRPRECLVYLNQLYAKSYLIYE